MHKHSIVLGLFLLGACGDSGTGGSSTGGSSTGGNSAGGANAGGANAGGADTGGANAGGTSAGGTSAGGGEPLAGKLAVNEIQAHHPEWVEIANATSQPVDASGAGLCDEDANGECELAGAMRFPAGTIIPANGHIVILTDQDPAAGVGPHTECALAGVTSCFFASWQISAADGETLRLVDSGDTEVSSFAYPPNATVDPSSSWSRLPDITGNGALGQPTPAAVNAAP